MKVKHKLFLLLIIALAAILRIYKLNLNPPSLYWDEVSLGYNAYSILQTGMDEHGERFPLARFIAFGDFKPPGYIYTTVPSVALFGLTEFAVRLPSSMAGILFVFVTYFLTYELFNNKKIALLGAFLIAISPWSLQLSRAAFEAHLAALFNLLAVFFFLRMEKGKGWNLTLSIFFFLLSFYTFNANRIIAPILLVSLSIFKIGNLFQNKKWLVVSVISAILMLIPSYSYLISRESGVRFQEVSIFTNLKILQKSNERIARHNLNLFSRLLHNRRVAYLQEFFKHYFDHFQGDFLFISGDVNPRLSSQAVGELYIFELPFLLIGVFISIRVYGKKSLPVFLLIFVSIIPAALARETPHMLRTATQLPAYQILIAVGLCYIFSKVKKFKTSFIGLLSFIIFVNFFYYLHNYYIHYPRDWSNEWQYGYKEAVKTVKEVENSFDYILVTQSLGRPYIYFLFYDKIDPKSYLQTRDAYRDWFGFWYIRGFGKYRFGLEQLPNLNGKILLIGTENETSRYDNVLKTISSPKDKVILRLVAI